MSAQPTDHGPSELLLWRCADAALFGDRLTLDEQRAAEEAAFDHASVEEEFERIAALLAVAEIAASPASPGDRAPPALETRLHALAATIGQTPARDGGTAHSVPGTTPALRLPATRRSASSEWILAAACTAFGAAATFAILRASDNRPVDGAATAVSMDAASFLRQHPEAVHWPWTGTDDSHVVGKVAGEAYFDPRSGAGLLIIEGLAPNDPSRERYQLWIFDEERDERYPVDGGVFDVRAGRAVLPVSARLPVSRPALFAVTVEGPGGAVVSDRRIALIARP